MPCIYNAYDLLFLVDSCLVHLLYSHDFNSVPTL